MDIESFIRTADALVSIFCTHYARAHTHTQRENDAHTQPLLVFPIKDFVLLAKLE